MDKYFSYLKELLWIKILVNKEYKINIYSSLMISLFSSIILLIIITVVRNQFGDLLGWNYQESVFFVFYIQTFITFSIIFYINSILGLRLLSGRFNIYLTKPINVFYQYFLSTLVIEVFIDFIIFFFISVGLFFYFDLYNDRLFFLLIFTFCATILNILIYRFFDSLAFIMKDNIFLFSLYSDYNEVFERFPAHMFKNRLRIVSLFFTNSLIGGFSLNYYYGYLNFNYIFNLFILIIFWIILFIILIVILWHYGLKRYEAYG